MKTETKEVKTFVKYSEIYSKDEWYWFIFRCPNCREYNMLNDKPIQYCSHCGTKIEFIKDRELQ